MRQATNWRFSSPLATVSRVLRSPPAHFTLHSHIAAQHKCSGRIGHKMRPEIKWGDVFQPSAPPSPRNTQLTFAQSIKLVFSPANATTTKYDDPSLGLHRMQKALSAMGNPHLAYRIAHVAGTNGKGSTVAMVEAIMRHGCGVKTGLFTSPHLHTLRERIRVGGDLISEASFAGLVSQWRDVLRADPAMTVFEKLTLLALAHFADEGVEWAVLEVGIGGRCDATNVPTAHVSGITHISMDHEALLGNTVDLIAHEKACIMKPGIPAFTLANQAPSVYDVFARKASEVNTTCTTMPPLQLPAQFSVEGSHQAHNAAVACAMVESAMSRGLLPFRSRDEIVDCIMHVWWPGRLETLKRPLTLAHVSPPRTHTPPTQSTSTVADSSSSIMPGQVTSAFHGFVSTSSSSGWSSPRSSSADSDSVGPWMTSPATQSLIVDCAHNPGGVLSLMTWLQGKFAGRPIVAVFACGVEKNLDQVLALVLPAVCAMIITQTDHFKAAHPEKVLQRVSELVHTSSPLVDLDSATACTVGEALSIDGPDVDPSAPRPVLATAASVGEAIMGLPGLHRYLEGAGHTASSEPVYVAFGSVFMAANARSAWVRLFPESLPPGDWAHVNTAVELECFRPAK